MAASADVVTAGAAAASAQRALAVQQHAAQALLRAKIVRDVVLAWKALFQPADARGSWPHLRDLLAALVRDRAGMSSALAARYYSEVRTAAGVAGTFQPSLPTPLSDEQIAATLDPMGLGSFLRAIKNGQTQDQAMNNAGVLLSGATSRLALQPARETIVDAVQSDREAVGWVRITGPKPCAWCAMLASRGPVYKSEKTAGFRAHDHCSCMPAAAMSGDEVWLQHGKDLRDQWDEVTAAHSGDAALNAWRRHWEGRSDTSNGTGDTPDGSA